MSVYNRDQKTRFKDVSGSTTLLATDDLSTTARVLVALKAGYTIFVQRVIVAVTTDDAATQLLQDSASTPLIIGKTKASPGLGPIIFEYGDEGAALTEAKNFELKNSGAGLAARISWEGYLKPTGTLTPATI